MTIKISCLTFIVIALITFNAKADDYGWGTTSGSTLVEIDATTGKLVTITYKGTVYSSFVLFNTATNNNLGDSLLVAENSSQIVYGLSPSNGILYTINTTLAPDVNNQPGFFATQIASLGVSPTGMTFVSANLLDISATGSLYQYNLTTKVLSLLGTYPNSIEIAGLSFYNSVLYGAQYSPSPGAIVSINVSGNGVSLTTQPHSTFPQGASSTVSLFNGASVLYVSNGGQYYSYNPATDTLTTQNDPTLPTNINSLTPIPVVAAATPTPATPTPSPTATPTPTATPKVVYSIPTGAMTVVSPETTSSGFPECAAGYLYSATELSTFAAGAVIDPNGTLSISRSYQTTTDGTSYATAVAASNNPASATWFWPSGSTNNHSGAAISYTAGQIDTAPALDFYYGKETLNLVYVSPGNPTTKTLDTKTIYLFPWMAGTPTAIFTNAVTNAAPSGTPFAFQGDPPRFTVKMTNLYPNGTTSVIIFPGTPVSNPTASGSATIAITRATTPTTPTTGGLYTPAAPIPITFETLATLQTITASATTPPTYTIAAMQTLPSIYATSTTNPAVVNILTFTLATPFNLNGTVGTVK
jgi:hypothetical protein